MEGAQRDMLWPWGIQSAQGASCMPKRHELCPEGIILTSFIPVVYWVSELKCPRGTFFHVQGHWTCSRSTEPVPKGHDDNAHGAGSRYENGRPVRQVTDRNQSTLSHSWPVRLLCLPCCLMRWETLPVIYCRLTEARRSTYSRWLLHLLCLSVKSSLTSQLSYRVDWPRSVTYRTGWPLVCRLHGALI